MNIICSADDRFVQHCSIMLTSVLVNNTGVVIWLLSEGLTQDNFSIINNEVNSKGGKLNYIIVDSDVIAKLPMPKDFTLSHISPATYYRLLISDILPINVHKAIYLDCDIIIRGSLKDLLNININNYSVGAVHQMYHEVEDARRLGYPIEFGYFNAGVLLVNLDFWREHNISSKLIDYIAVHYKTIKMHDQDALNAVLYTNALRLPCKWNMLHFFFLVDSKTINGTLLHNSINNYSDYKSELKENRKNPIVVHYVSKPKPWQEGCVHPFVKEYYSYAKKTLTYCKIMEPNWVKTKINSIIYNTEVYIRWIIRPIYKFLLKSYI